MRFRLLGPVEARDRAGRRIELGRRRERGLLALLLLEVDTLITIDRLASLLWDGEPPSTARRQLSANVSRLRAAVAVGGVEIIGSPAGYRLSADPDEIDAHRFRAEVQQARASDDPDDRIRWLETALARWRGPLAVDALDETARARVGRGLSELRDSARELLFETRLRAGQGVHLVGDLYAFADQHADRESAQALLMWALAEAGRMPEALERFQELRRRSVDQLGQEPGAAVQDMHRRLLRGLHPAAAGPARSAGGGLISAGTEARAPATGEGRPGPAPEPRHPVAAEDRQGPAPPLRPDREPRPQRPRQVPTAPAGFVGRASQLAALDGLVSSPTLVTGPAGVGKTALAVHWARNRADWFPDGQLYADLRGFSSDAPVRPVDVLGRFLRALDPDARAQPPTSEAEAAAAFRSRLADRRMLILLDNVRDEDQVRPLLPGAPGCAVVVTSRNQLMGLVVRDGARALPLDVLSAPEAADLLTRRIGTERAGAEPDTVAQIVTACGRLPLALAIVAARAGLRPRDRLAALVTDLGLDDDEPRLDALHVDDPHTDPRTVFSWSYQLLSPRAASVFRHLSLDPGPTVGPAAAAAAAGTDPRDTGDALAELVRAHLVGEPRPDRFQLHDLLREYAAERLAQEEAPEWRAAAAARVLDHYLHSARLASRPLYPERAQTLTDVPAGTTAPATADEALAWYLAEHPNLVGAVAAAAEAGHHEVAWELGWTLSRYLDQRGHWADWVTVQEIAAESALALGDPARRAKSTRDLARAYAWLGRYDDARRNLDLGLELCDRLGDGIGTAFTRMLGAWLLEREGRYEDALGHARAALATFEAEGHRKGSADALNIVGWYSALCGRSRAAIHYCGRALALQREVGFTFGEANTWDSLGYAHHQLGNDEKALRCYGRALALFQEIADRYHEASVWGHLGDVHAARADRVRAREAWERAHAIFDDLDHTEAAEVATKLAAL